jgi:hypothetical protein
VFIQSVLKAARREYGTDALLEDNLIARYDDR